MTQQEQIAVALTKMPGPVELAGERFEELLTSVGSLEVALELAPLIPSTLTSKDVDNLSRSFFRSRDQALMIITGPPSPIKPSSVIVTGPRVPDPLDRDQDGVREGPWEGPAPKQ